MSYIVHRRDLDFYLYELFNTEALFQTERYGDYDRETITAMLDAAQLIAEQEFYPLAELLDANEPEFADGKVTVIPEVRKALNAYIDSGFLSAGFDADVGGMQLPWVARQAISGMFTCANTGLSGYQFLTAANANLLNTCGSEELKNKYLEPLMAGRWFGTMCLSETQAGSSLGDIRTQAKPTGDGAYKISGSKMWISGGDHDLTENIIHMVLAKTPGGPPGVRGISLFLVPKVRVNAIAVGSTKTDALNTVLTPEIEQTMVDLTPMARLGEVEDIALGALYLCAPAASYVTGEILGVNGGLERLNMMMPRAWGGMG